MNLTKVNNLIKITSDETGTIVDCTRVVNYSSAHDGLSEFAMKYLKKHPVLEVVSGNEDTNYSYESHISDLSIIPDIPCYWTESGVTFIYGIDGTILCPENGNRVDIYTKKMRIYSDPADGSAWTPKNGYTYFNYSDVVTENTIVRNCYKEGISEPLFVMSMVVVDDVLTITKSVGGEAATSLVFKPAN